MGRAEHSDESVEWDGSPDHCGHSARDQSRFEVADGPPLGGRQLAEYYLKLPDGIEEGYAAIYRRTGEPDLVTVYGLRLAATESVDAFTAPRKATDASTWIAVGQIVGVVAGQGVCFDAIADYLKSLAQ